MMMKRKKKKKRKGKTDLFSEFDSSHFRDIIALLRFLVGIRSIVFIRSLADDEEELSLVVKDLDTVVGVIDDDDLVEAVDGHSCGVLQLAFSPPLLSKHVDEVPILVKHLDPVQFLGFLSQSCFIIKKEEEES